MERTKPVGIKKIAEIAGVSPATVSRVLNNPEKVSEDTRKKVLSTVQQYQYIHPNRLGKLSTDSRKTIVLFVHDITNPYNVELFDEINRRVFENEYEMVLCNTQGDQDLENRYYQYCRQINTCGVIYMGDTGDMLLEKKNTDSHFPTILLDREQPELFNCYSIRQNNHKGSALLVDYLYKLNHRKIGYITGNLSMAVARERLEGFLAAMDKIGLPVPGEYVKEGFFTVQGGTACFDYFYSMADAPTAIIAANDLSARGFIMRANFLGVKIPDEFSVCGYDGTNVESFYPVITSIKQDIPKIADAIFSIILNEETADKRTLLDVSMSMGVTCHKI